MTSSSGSTARTKRPEDARRIAATFVDSAVSALLARDFAPARGAALASSAQAPNPASRPGARCRHRCGPAGLPCQCPLPLGGGAPEGLEYREGQGSFDSADIAPVMSAHICDPATVAALGNGQPAAAAAGRRQPVGVGGRSRPPRRCSRAHRDRLGPWHRCGTVQGPSGEPAVLRGDALRRASPGPARTRRAPGSRATVDGLTQYVAARRVGDLIVAAAVKDAEAETARQRAIELATSMASAAQASRLDAEGR